MVKHSEHIDEGKVDEEKVVADRSSTQYNIKDGKSAVMKLQLRISARVILPGPVTGKRYIWERSGAVVEVDEQDVTGLLEKKLGDKPCCGGNPDNLKLFVLIE